MIAAAALAIATAIAVRVVSLAPALTEDLFAIGAGPQVVGVDDLSNRPPAALHVPRVGSMRTINSEAVAALDPDLVVGIAYQAPGLRDLSRAGVPTQTLEVDTLADDFAAISSLGRATGHAREASRLLAGIGRRLDAARRATHALKAPRALAFIGMGLAPFYTAGRGSYIDDLFAIAHIRNVAGDLHAAYPALSAETIEAADPDVLVVPRGAAIPNEPPWSRLRAVRLHRIVAIDEDDYLRPGPRVADVVDALVRGVAPYRALAGARANAYTAPSASRRTAIGIPYTRPSSASSKTLAGVSHAISVRAPSSAIRSAKAAATLRSCSTTTAVLPPATSRRTSARVSNV
jgi:ABC-type Fe3+-hydroxamate transport system substrate-binding protein